MKVGDYVRTENKGIFKIRDDKPFKDDRNRLNYLTYGNYTCVLKENIIKSSPNIIDLIEVGDYVNGYMVENIGAGLNGDVIEIATGTNYFQSPSLYEDDIKSIVTKEQFESIEYKIERQA